MKRRGVSHCGRPSLILVRFGPVVDAVDVAAPAHVGPFRDIGVPRDRRPGKRIVDRHGRPLADEVRDLAVETVFRPSEHMGGIIGKAIDVIARDVDRTTASPVYVLNDEIIKD